MIAQRDGTRPAAAMAIILAQLSLVLMSNANAAVTDAPQRCFKVFDGTLFLNKPNLSSYGMKQATVIVVKNWLAKSAASDAIPEEKTIRDWVAKRKISPDLFVLDLEHWPVRGTLQEVRKSVDGYLTILERVRRSGQSGVIGYYGLPPIRNYWDALQGPSATKYRSWQAENDQWQPLANAVDVLFPSLYTFYDDRNGWVRFARENLAEARRLSGGKPIYAFIWPRYHESNKTLGMQLIPEDFWRLQLQTLSQYADGAVIWGGWQEPWDEQAAWWQVTRQFLRTESRICREPSVPQNLTVDPDSH